MDSLRSIMQSLDDISKLIPEGTYLEMCDNLKMVHDQIPCKDDPPVRDNRRVPFQPYQSEYRPDWYDESAQNENIIRKLLEDMQIADQSLKILKPIQRVTKKVREDAIKRLCHWQHRAGRRETLDLNEWTFENYIQTGPSLEALRAYGHTENEIKWCTSKGYERQIYWDYKRDENQRIGEKRAEVLELKRNLEQEISDYRNRQNVLRTLVYNSGPAYNL